MVVIGPPSFSRVRSLVLFAALSNCFLQWLALLNVARVTWNRSPATAAIVFSPFQRIERFLGSPNRTSRSSSRGEMLGHSDTRTHPHTQRHTHTHTRTDKHLPAYFFTDPLLEISERKAINPKALKPLCFTNLIDIDHFWIQPSQQCRL